MKCAILANGPSLASVDIARIKYPILGLNRSWKVCPDPWRHFVLEHWHYDQAPEWHERMAREGKLWCAGASWKIGNRVMLNSEGMPGFGNEFSREPEDGVVAGLNGVGSVTYAALQLLYWWGVREVFALGLDLHGLHFDGTGASEHVARQNELFEWLPSDLKVSVAGSPESRARFPHVSMEEVYA